MKQLQRQIILKHLKRKSITSMEAFRLYNITRLASVIEDLRFDSTVTGPEAGADIDTEMIVANGTRYARYHLVRR